MNLKAVLLLVALLQLIATVKCDVELDDILNEEDVADEGEVELEGFRGLAVKCTTGANIKKKACQKKIKADCPVVWLGTKGCKGNQKRTKGCQDARQCSRYTCQSKCEQSKYCQWGIPSGDETQSQRCFSLEYEEIAQAGDKINGVLMFESKNAYTGNKGIDTYDNICLNERPTKENTNKEYYCNGLAFAYMCSTGRSADNLHKLIGVGKSQSVYGPNGFKIGEMDKMAGADNILDNSPQSAGIKTRQYWAGCYKNGEVPSAASLTCEDWTSRSSTKQGICGDGSKTDSSFFKFWNSFPCNDRRKFLCICERVIREEY